MEVIKVLEGDEFAIVLWNTICADMPADIGKKFGIEPKGRDTEVNVQVLVNGVEVPFLEAVREAFRRHSLLYEQAVREAALKMLDGSSLYDLIHALQGAEWAIKEQIDKLEVPR